MLSRVEPWLVRPIRASVSAPSAPVHLHGAQVSVSLFRALGVRPLTGRLFADEDEQPGNEHVVVLSHETWRAWFGSSEAIVGQPISMNERMYRVIGVMPEGFGFPSIASSMSLTASGDVADAPEFWMPLVALPRPALPATGGMTRIDSNAVVFNATTIGMRTHEFGIRLTLGATPGSVVGSVMRDAAYTVLPGLAGGLLGALYLSRFLEALLFGVRPRDPATFAGVAALFLVVATIACYLPARRATRVDPVVALRAE